MTSEGSKRRDFLSLVFITKSYLYIIKISDPNIIREFCFYFMVLQGTVERTKWIKKVMTNDDHEVLPSSH